MEHREVFLVTDSDEVCLGTVGDVLALSGLGGDKSGYSEDDQLNPNDWGVMLQFANVLGGIVGDIIGGETDEDSATVTIEIR